MLKQLKYISIFLLMFISKTLSGSEYQDVHEQQLYQAQNVSELAEQLFGDAHSKIQASKSPLTFAQLFTLEALLDETRHNQLMEFHQGLSIAFDTNSDLSHLVIYGLNKQKQNRYTLDLAAIPQWAEVSELFWFVVSSRQLYEAKIDLLKMGLTEQDIKTIRTHIEQHNLFKTISEDKILAIENIKYELEMIDNNDLLAATARKFSYQLKTQERIAWFDWVQDLLAQFSPKQQQILFEYGKSNLGYQLIIGTEKSKQKSLDYAQRLINGEAIETVKNNLRQMARQ